MPTEKSVFDRFNELSENDKEILDAINKANQNQTQKLEELERKIHQLESKQTQSHVQPNIAQGQSKPNVPQKRLTPLQLFIYNSEKNWRWFGSPKEFKQKKLIVILVLSISIILQIITPIVLGFCISGYSIASFMQNIWIVFSFILLSKTLSLKYIQEVNDLNSCSILQANKDDLGMIFFGKIKTPYIVFFIIYILGFIFSLFSIGMHGKETQAISVILEIISLISVVFSSILSVTFQSNYAIMWLVGKNAQTGEKIVLARPVGSKEFILESRFYELFKYWKE